MSPHLLQLLVTGRGAVHRVRELLAGRWNSGEANCALAICRHPGGGDRDASVRALRQAVIK